MNINQLTSFVQAAELGSLSKAAISLFTVQSAISRQVKALEEELETKLFIRHGRGLKLTDAGQHLLTRATHILKEIEDTKSEIVSSNKKLRGRVTVGLPPSVANVLVTPLTKRLKKEYPQIKLRLVDAFSETLSSWLLQREVDFVILYDNQEHSSSRTYSLLEEKLYLATSSDSELAQQDSISFTDLKDIELVLPSQQHSLRRLIDRKAKEYHCKLNVSIDADSLVIIKELVRSKMASSILSLTSVNNDIKEGAIKSVLIKDPTITRQLLLAMPTDRPASNASLKVSEILREEIVKLVESGKWEGSLIMAEN